MLFLLRSAKTSSSLVVERASLDASGEPAVAVGSQSSTTEELGKPALNSSSAAAEASGSRDLSATNNSFLRELYIKDFALISEQRVELQPGLNVITGESGAGKSVLVSALGQILGSAAPENCIRQPAKEALIEGRVFLSPALAASVQQLLKTLGLPAKALPKLQKSGTQLLLRREIFKGGKEGSVRSRSSINGISVSQRVLRELGNAIVDVNGQHAAQALRDASEQIQLLDRLAGTQTTASRFGDALRRLRALECELKALEELGNEDVREDLQNMIDKIDEHEVAAGEERELRRRLKEMQARKTNVERCGVVRTTIGGDGSSSGVEELLQSVEADIRSVLDQERMQARMAQYESSAVEDESSEEEDEDLTGEGLLEAALEHMQSARDSLLAAEQQVSEYATAFRFSEHEYKEAADRLSTLDRLQREFRCSSTEALLDLRDKASQDLEHWFNSQGSREGKEQAIAKLQAVLAEAAGKLSRNRREAAGKLRVAVESCLTDLAMSGSRFDVRIGWEGASSSASAADGLFVPESSAQLAFEEGGRSYKTSSDGLDAVEFLLAAGPAEPLRPLGAVASGGERSRIMLALKAAPAAIDQTPTTGGNGSAVHTATSSSSGDSEEEIGGSPILVLDELDSGVGGRLGMPVGKMLRHMVGSSSQGPSQILCVSHLPQVAASASHHVCVRKRVAESGRVVTYFETLAAEDEKCREIAAMGGVREEEARNMMHLVTRG